MFIRCFRWRARKSTLLSPLLQNNRLMGDLAEVVHEYTQRVVNQNSFVLRGEFGERLVDVYPAICNTVQLLVDADAADSISRVRYLNDNVIQVMCDSTEQCQRITSQRLAFSSIDTTPHPSAAVQRLSRTKMGRRRVTSTEV